MRRWVWCVALLAWLWPAVVLAAGVGIAPEDVTWDGFRVRVLWGFAERIRVRLLDSGGELVVCEGLAAGEDCWVSLARYGGEWVEVIAEDLEGGEDRFQLRLARHVELGRWSLEKLSRILQELIALPVNVVVQLRAELAVSPTGSGYQQLDAAVNRLRNAGVFGQANQAANQIRGAVSSLEAERPDFERGPRNAGPRLDPSKSSTTPCQANEWQRLSFCFPMRIGLNGETYYFRMDLPNHILEHLEAYRQLFKAISWGIWIWFGVWLVRQFVPRFSA